MSISRQNLTIVIVTFKSNNVIHNCIKSIDKDIKIIIIDNSNDNKFKQELEETYKNGVNNEIGILVNSSRSIIYAGNGTDFVDFAFNEAKELQNQMKKLLNDLIIHYIKIKTLKSGSHLYMVLEEVPPFGLDKLKSLKNILM